MGSTLTNTQPKDTYKSLLKTSDSTELSATAKYVSDGNGNDSALALSTGNIGIGTTSPAQKLDVSGTVSADRFLSTSSNASLPSFGVSAGNGMYLAGTNIIAFSTDSTERVRIQAGGGISFNGDSAADNALDDYEEGTWTPTFTDTLGNNVTASSTGTYTKIGRQVTLSLYTAWSNKSAASAGAVVYMSGAPFSMNKAGSGNITYYNNMNLTTVGALNVSNAGVGLCYFPIHDNAVEASFLTFGETTNTSTFYFTFTYFV